MSRTQDEEDESILEQLMLSRKIILTSRGPLWMESPVLQDKIFAKYLYDSELKRLIDNNIAPSIEDSLKEHRALGLWGNEQEDKLKKIPGFIEDTEANIKIENNGVRKKKLQKWLKTLYTMYNELINAKNTLLSSTAEAIANENATIYLVWRCIRNIDNERLWPTYESALSSEDIAYIKELISIYNINQSFLDIKIIRRIARSALWRIRWSACKDNIKSLFGREANDLDMNQFMLVYWSQIYDSVYDAYERPPNDVIEDDERLDNWLKEQGEKVNRDAAQKFYGKGKTKNTKHTNDKIAKSGEVFSCVEGYYNEDGTFIKYSEEERWKEIERIRKLNEPNSRRLKAKEEQELQKSPGVFIQESKLRKNKETIESMGGNITKEKR